MEKYFSINEGGHSIKCKLYCGDVRGIAVPVIFCHGFSGHKDNKAAERFAQTAISKHKGVGVLTFDWPAHGDDVKKRLELSDCDAYLTLVIDYVRRQLAPKRLFAYATSFGGYLALKYLSEHGNPFEGLALRCPAVEMYKSMTRILASSSDEEKLRKGGDVQVGFDRKVSINSRFLEELRAADITAFSFFDYAEDMIILQGMRDEVVSPEAVRAFADDNLIELIEFEKADHRFQDPALMGQAIKRILEFFAL